MKVHEVFGISPSLREESYVDRGMLDEELARVLSRTNHVAVRGPSKSGKSWLRQKVLRSPIIVQCRLGKPFTDIYVDALSQLDVRLTVRESRQGVFKASVSAKGEVGAALLGKVGLSGGVGGERGSAVEGAPVGHDVNDLRFVADIIKASSRRLAIEDFHYMSSDDRRGFAFDLKALWDYGVFVVIIGIWSESNLILHLNPDLAGRVHEVSVEWTDEDLMKILEMGGRALNIDFSADVRRHLCQLAYANAGVLQQLTLLSLDEAGISDKRGSSQCLGDLAIVDNAAMTYAEQLNPLYQQFAKNVSMGIRTRSNATGIYAYAMAAIVAASDDQLVRGLPVRDIFLVAHARQERIQLGNLKTVLEKLPELQVDVDGRGLILSYSRATEEITVVDRQLLLYRRYATINWPWEDLIGEANAAGGQVSPE